MTASDWNNLLAAYAPRLGAKTFAERLADFEPERLKEEDFMGAAARVFGSAHGAEIALLLLKEAVRLPKETALEGLAEALDVFWGAASQAGDVDPAIVKAHTAEIDRLKSGFEGLLVVLGVYLNGENAPDDPNILLEQARASGDLTGAKMLAGRAGAAALLGAPVWPYWLRELPAGPLWNWVSCWQLLVFSLRETGLMPCQPPEAQRAIFAAHDAEQTNSAAEEDGADSPDLQALMEVLLFGGEKLTEKLRRRVPPFTPEVIDRLSFILNAEEYANEDSEGLGYAPVHAARLLAESGSAAAVYPLIERSAENDYESVAYSDALLALEKLGPLSLEPLLDTFRYSNDLEWKCTLAGPLGHVGRGDERAFKALEALYRQTTWDKERMLPVIALGGQGDPRVKFIFYNALAGDPEIGPDGIREIAAALRNIDPGNRAEQDRLRNAAMRRYDARTVRFDSKGRAFCLDCGRPMERGFMGAWQHVEPGLAPRRTARPPAAAGGDARFANVGRNDLCPCGSGRKFKHCHGAPQPARP